MPPPPNTERNNGICILHWSLLQHHSSNRLPKYSQLNPKFTPPTRPRIKPQKRKILIIQWSKITPFNITSPFTYELDCHGDHNDGRPARLVPSAETPSFSLRGLLGFECHEVIELGVDLDNIGKLSLDRQERQTTQSLLSHT